MPKKFTHGGRRSNQTGRPPLPPGAKLRRRPIGMLESDWDKAQALAEALGLKSVDELLRQLVRAA